jgi:hypothetical protein
LGERNRERRPGQKCNERKEQGAGRGIGRKPRNRDKPSDHTPVTVPLDLWGLRFNILLHSLASRKSASVTIAMERNKPRVSDQSGSVRPPIRGFQSHD